MTFSERLKEIREKSRLSALKFGALCGVSRSAQYAYEKGDRCPDSEYLMKLAAADFDVIYLLTGERDQNRDPLNKQHSQIISAFETADPKLVIAALRVLGINDIEITKS